MIAGQPQSVRLVQPLAQIEQGGGARARELVDHGTPIEAACRIVILEDQLQEAQRINGEYRRTAGSVNPSAAA